MRFGSLAASVALATFVSLSRASAQTLQPADPQPDAAALKPGLAVKYYREFWRHIDELVEWMKYDDGKEGPPLPMLNYRTGQGKVLTSEGKDGVGAHITGYINLDTPGIYSSLVRSNDGVRLKIGGEVLIEDPDVHADRFSEIAEVMIDTPGWYPVDILYFERKNTSTLELYWEKPGAPPADQLPFVPAEVFAHMPAS